VSCDADIRYVVYYRNVYPDGRKTKWYELGNVPYYRNLDMARESAKNEAGKLYMDGHVTESRLSRQIVIETPMEEYK